MYTSAEQCWHVDVQQMCLLVVDRLSEIKSTENWYVGLIKQPGMNKLKLNWLTILASPVDILTFAH